MSDAEQQDRVYSFIGHRIRERRKLLKLNQADLAELMGFSYQQMQKYESGASHVSAGKLLLFAKALNVNLGYFFEGLSLDEAIGKRFESSVIQKTRTRALRLLLVEDNPADVLLFRKALERHSGQVEAHVLHDGEMVLDFLQNNDTKFHKKFPDLVVLDLSLPKLGGMELLRSIKKSPKMMALPVVVLTNSINVKDMMESYRCGAAGFIQKSVDLEEYIESIGTIVDYWARVVALPFA